MSVQIFKEECDVTGINPEKLRSVARRLNQAVRDLDKLGLLVFGGSGNGTIRVPGTGDDSLSSTHCGNIIVAYLDGTNWDGGDGGAGDGSDGLRRGE